jgi:membrane fusion protein, copper/silver efflux system
MNRRIVVLIVGALTFALLGVAVGWYFATRIQPGMAMPVPQPPKPASEVETKPAERKVLYWTDPMVPGSRFDKPGKSPFMDMQLEPVYAEDQAGESGADAASVNIAPRTLQNMGVRTVKVEEGSLAHRIDAVGIVGADEHRIEAVHAHTAGWVEKVYVRAAGDPVRAGQPMFELYSPDLVAAQEEYLLALQHHDDALIDAAEQKLHVLYFHERDLQRLKESGQAQRRMTVYAPIGGVVSELMIRPGMAVSAGQSVYTLTNLSTVWVNAQVPEAQAQWAAPGTQAEIRFAALPGKTYKGKVEYIYPDVTAASRTLSARILLANAGGELRPNMYAGVILLGGMGKVVPLVPREAVIETGTRKVVIVADGGGRFHAQAVTTGAEESGRVEILEGLGTGLEVVVGGQFLIDSEANLKTALDRLGASTVPDVASSSHQH